MNPIKDVIDMIATDALEEQEPRDRYEVALDIIQEQTAENTLLRSRLTIVEEALKAIGEHEHCDDDNVYGTFPPGGRASYAKGHRCCATIANAALKKIKEGK